MADGEDLVLWESSAPRSPAEFLTTLFYGWERRGRGWQVWPYHVALEPPFRPFVPELRGAIGDVAPHLDDARKPTLLSRVADRLTGRSAKVQEPVELIVDEPTPEPYADSSGIVALQVALPPPVKIASDLAESFLLSLGACTAPLSFEVVGSRDAIGIQLVCRTEDRTTVQAQLAAHFPDASITEDGDSLLDSWEADTRGIPLVVDFGLAHEFMRPLRTAQSFDPDPLIAVSGALADLEEGETGALQVLFQRCRARGQRRCLPH